MAQFQPINTSTFRYNNPVLAEKVAHLSITIVPLVSVTSGLTHPDFPATMLHFHLLTEAELEEIAHFYHQRTPSRFTETYPKPMGWKQGMDINEKRRKFGKFVGFRGCDTPKKTDQQRANDLEKEYQLEDDILAAMIRETRRQIAEDEEAELLFRGKIY